MGTEAEQFGGAFQGPGAVQDGGPVRRVRHSVVQVGQDHRRSFHADQVGDLQADLGQLGPEVGRAVRVGGEVTRVQRREEPGALGLVDHAEDSREPLAR